MATEKTQPLIDAGKAAMHRADWEKAVAAFREASSIKESAEVLEYLGWAAWWLNDAALSFDALERAYQLYCAEQDRRGAARTAVWLARALLEFRGEHAVANGWLQRAHSHLEGLEESPELG